ncbi:NAD(P)/FAD-dependent oxidoreductase [Variovorax terrae]|uniref:NAD(P)/FAD-dependent oxidoreductase n=1 Tax=Variovorax terrae TaxID=2923278 RepID=A0A9X1VWZ7_9BURK|nr:NAD(P)/FAD-dependent oxidoreductase [Variovorax terrae]MCJ0763619.1 NAD(P)/FAD-dependent oxidoreductase [Variovorax terrae]
MDSIDALVIGAGVVGLAVARALAQSGLETIVAEAGPAIGQGVSSRNSEVIHAGLYYTPGSLKARLCVRGRDLLYALCASHGVDHARCGKLVVATQPSQQAALRALQDKAAANGVPVQWLEAREAQALEPQLRCTAALLSPATGIVDSHGFMLALQGDLERAGGMVALDSAVAGARLDAGGALHELHMADGSVLGARLVVNAAALQACALARRFEGLDPAHVPAAYYAKGHYFTLAGRAPFRHLIYPVPEAAGLGVHLTLDLGGQAKFGPDVQWVDSPDDLEVDPARGGAFEAEVRKYWPGLPSGALAPGYAGIRPKIQAPHEAARDFLIQGPGEHGVPGLVNLFGIESPGLTSALAIGEHVRDLLLHA